jgi:hypothetical protein
MRRPALLLLVMAFSLLYAPVAGAGALSVSDPWVREAPPDAKALAAYMTIVNASTTAVALESASSPDFMKVELHRTDMSHGMAHMVKQKAVRIEAGTSVSLKPGDYHLMLMGPVRVLRAGDEVRLRLVFDNGEVLEVTAVVRKQ